MAAWIFSSEEYTRRYHELYAELIANYFDSGVFEEIIDSTTALISPYVEKDPTKFCTFEEFTTGAAVLKEFCLLRAQSVHGQLDGTVPSTSEGQQADSSALIDASAITLSDMGSMNGGGGPGGMGGMFDRGQVQQNQQDQQEQQGQTDNAQMPERPQMPDGLSSPETETGNTWFPLAVSALVLLAGLVIAFKFKR